MKPKLHIERMIELLCEIGEARGITKATSSNQIEVACLISEILEREMKDMPKNVRDHIYHDTVVSSAIIKQMYRGKPTVHIIGERFGSHLNRTNVDVPCSHLLKAMGSAYYIEFPKSVTLGGDNYYKTAMVVEAVTDKKVFPQSTEEGDKMLMFMFPDFNSNGEPRDSCTYYWMAALENFTIAESIDGLEQYLSKEIPQYDKDAIAFAAKCILYINSGEPDLENEAVK